MPLLRRNLKHLQQVVVAASSDREKAVALYELAVFHDNNGREADAIPCYRNAIKLGLDRETKVKAMAWLASSLYKIGRPTTAMRYVNQAMAADCPPELMRFLVGLRGRIRRKITAAAVDRPRRRGRSGK